MSEKRIVLQAFVDTSFTPHAIEFLRNFKLSQLEAIKIIPAEHDNVIVNFYFITSTPNNYNKVAIKNAFSVGYKNEGSMGLHDIMIDAGYKEDIASKVFIISKDKETTLKKSSSVA